ncbi:hypothetical protein LBMAG41_15770 [Cyanobium sp.]|jgi:hypothetical protein|nr:hypothetical protein LBMAG41_15770 [Cyanobium sp.]
MLVLPSLLAVAVWFTKPPLGSTARITVNNPGANTIFQIVGIDKNGVELGPNNFSSSPDQLTVGGNRPRQSFIRFNPDALWAVCAVSVTKSEAKALNSSGAMGQVSMRTRACKRYSSSP